MHIIRKRKRSFYGSALEVNYTQEGYQPNIRKEGTLYFFRSAVGFGASYRNNSFANAKAGEIFRVNSEGNLERYATFNLALTDEQIKKIYLEQ
ncbi:MAG: hypothetical protein ACRESZ_15555 [Methylococcales bacterium]